MESLPVIESITPPAARHSIAGRRSATLLLCLVPFVLLCTMNSATYRYGASDQAFYVPAVMLDVHPDWFPRDAALIRAQGELTLVDETVGGLARITGVSLPVMFAAMYVGSLVLLALAIWSIASHFFRTAWGGVALLAAMTLRHSIARTGTNTLEGYFHPRQLAFALGALSIAMVLRRRYVVAVAALALAAAIHPTTAMWFVIWVAVALAVVDRQWRLVVGAGAIVSGVLAFWAFTTGPLAGRLTIMDAEWLATLTEKVYLFPLGWPAAAWITNLLPVGVIASGYGFRRKHGLTDPVETGVVAGSLALAVMFFAILPFNAAHVALAVQLQPARMFWMLDFLATVYLVWIIAEGTGRSPRRALTVATLIVLLSAVRGGYVKWIEFPERPLARIDVQDDDWRRVMVWARSTHVGSGWLADPMHAVRYGTSVRAAGARDVFVEAVKDTAIGMYDRATAMRTRERLEAIGDFATLDTARARALSRRYDLDYLVSERPFDLPVAFQSGPLKVYRLRAPG
jgi:hypothetical protein